MHPVLTHLWSFPQANNLVLHTAVEHFWRSCGASESGDIGLPHIITSNVEHDSVKLVAEHLQKEKKAGGRLPSPAKKKFSAVWIKVFSFYHPSQVFFVNLLRLPQTWPSCQCPGWQGVWMWKRWWLQCVQTPVSSPSCWPTTRPVSSWWATRKNKNPSMLVNNKSLICSCDRNSYTLQYSAKKDHLIFLLKLNILLEKTVCLLKFVSLIFKTRPKIIRSLLIPQLGISHYNCI